MYARCATRDLALLGLSLGGRMRREGERGKEGTWWDAEEDKSVKKLSRRLRPRPWSLPRADARGWCCDLPIAVSRRRVQLTGVG